MSSSLAVTQPAALLPLGDRDVMGRIAIFVNADELLDLLALSKLAE